jgi:hypothetical protein
MLKTNKIECYFRAKDDKLLLRVPYVRELLSFNINDSDDDNINDNYMIYNGHFRIIDDTYLPMIVDMYINQKEPEPYMIKDNLYYYNYIINNKYTVEIYKRETLEDSSIFFNNNDGNIVENSRICLSPIYKEKIWFKILNKYD